MGEGVADALPLLLEGWAFSRSADQPMGRNPGGAVPSFAVCRGAGQVEGCHSFPRSAGTRKPPFRGAEAASPSPACRLPGRRTTVSPLPFPRGSLTIGREGAVSDGCLAFSDCFHTRCGRRPPEPNWPERTGPLRASFVHRFQFGLQYF